MGTHHTNNKNIDALAKHFGSNNKLAKALGISHQAVSDWRKKGKIPSGAALRIEKLTEGKFNAMDLVDGGVE